ncbi:hypothetical protein T01_12514 [Trichinella spiralis]|uniref:Uncharacterized protein n=1 Tax=Trichinella spiralis TaxID=6334 RepID=A0A0V1BBL8_TRISP|nr:hypothetical protein T01_12514 [Trichinella spiralis]
MRWETSKQTSVNSAGRIYLRLTLGNIISTIPFAKHTRTKTIRKDKEEAHLEKAKRTPAFLFNFSITSLQHFA